MEGGRAVDGGGFLTGGGEGGNEAENDKRADVRSARPDFVVSGCRT
jgi:hypothetical protein